MVLVRDFAVNALRVIGMKIVGASGDHCEIVMK